MSTATVVNGRNLVKNARKTVRAIFPVLKEKGEHLKAVTEKLTLIFNHELDIRLQKYGVNILPIGHLESFARGVVGYSVGTSLSVLRWLRLANRKFVVKGCFGTETSLYHSLGDNVGTAPYDHITEEMLKDAFPKFLGDIVQAVPPFDGPARPPEKGPLPDLVAVMKRPAICHSISCTQLSLPHFSLEIVCGPGFSPRMFVHDLGKELGSCGHLTHLEQVQQGPFVLEHALPSYRWSWEEASAASEKLHDLWYPHVAKVRDEMKDKVDRFQGLAKYY